MGSIAQLLGHRIYVDANIWIYYAEREQPYFSTISPVFDRSAAGDLALVTCELTLLEVLSKPGPQWITLRDAYVSMLSSRPGVEVVPVTRREWVAAAAIRATYRCSLPDSVHLSAAIQNSCRFFLTNDNRVPVLPDIQRLRLSDLESN